MTSGRVSLIGFEDWAREEVFWWRNQWRVFKHFVIFRFFKLEFFMTGG